MTEIMLYTTLALAIILNVVLIWLLVKKLGASSKKEDGQGLQLILQQINELNRTVDTKIGESSKMMHESVRNQFGESQKLIKEITRELTEVKETGKQVVSFADQLQNLQDIRDNLLSTYNSISKPDLDKLNQVLPQSTDIGNILVSLEKISQDRGIRLRKAEFKTDQEDDVKTIQASNSMFNTIDISGNFFWGSHGL